MHWQTESKGVVFKAGPGPPVEVGKLDIGGFAGSVTTARAVSPSNRMCVR